MPGECQEAFSTGGAPDLGRVVVGRLAKPETSYFENMFIQSADATSHVK